MLGIERADSMTILAVHPTLGVGVDVVIVHRTGTAHQGRPFVGLRTLTVTLYGAATESWQVKMRLSRSNHPVLLGKVVSIRGIVSNLLGGAYFTGRGFLCIISSVFGWGGYEKSQRQQPSWDSYSLFRGISVFTDCFSLFVVCLYWQRDNNFDGGASRASGVWDV